MTSRKLLLVLFIFAAGVSKSYSQGFKTEESVYTYLKDNILDLDKIEGVYTCNSYSQTGNNQPVKQPIAPKKVAIVKNENGISAYWIVENTREISQRSFMEIKKRDYINTYDAKIYDWPTKEIEFIDETSFKVVKANPKKKAEEGVESYYMEKIFPSQADIDKAMAAHPKSGSCTGFLINKNFIVTNLHVVEKAKSIKVKGVKGDFGITYTAVLKQSDKNNDLAILSFEDTTIKFPCPITMNMTPPDAGKEVLVLAYPLSAASGNEVKLSNGLVSAKTGYQGDIASYQINVPMQNGFLGGPVFDKTGALIGVITTDKEGTATSSYCAKTGILKNVMDALPVKLKMPVANALAAKPLPEKVKTLGKFIYIIEVEY